MFQLSRQRGAGHRERGHEDQQRGVRGAGITLGNGNVVYLHGDHLGSAALVTDSTGAKVSGEEYGAWGQVRSGDNSATTPIDFTGQHKDGTGLLYYGARYYDPALGRFLSADTQVGSPSDPQSLNPYSYVRNNPVKRTDPTGHNDCDGQPCGSGGGYNPPLNQIAYPYNPYIPVGTPYMPPMGNPCQLPNANCPGTATPTAMPYSTPTANPSCGTAAANYSCPFPTSTMPPPTATSTPGGFYTAMGVFIPPGIVRPDGSSPPFDPATGAPYYGPPPLINPDAYAQPFGQGLQYRLPMPYSNDPERYGPPGGERLPRYPLDPQGNPVTGMPYSYTEYDIYARGQNPTSLTRGTQRIVVNNVTGQGYYTDDHYFVFTPFYP